MPSLVSALSRYAERACCVHPSRQKAAHYWLTVLEARGLPIQFINELNELHEQIIEHAIQENYEKANQARTLLKATIQKIKEEIEKSK